MKFLSIPENGASWQEPLLYSVDLETTDRVDSHVEVVDVGRNVVIASFYVYGGTSFEVDISPYVRIIADMAPIAYTRILSYSPTAYNIEVRVNGVASLSRRFYRAKFDVDTPKILSSIPDNPEVVFGETVRMTLYAKERVAVTVQSFAKNVQARSYSILSDGLPVEFVYPLLEVDEELTAVEITITLDGNFYGTIRYKLVGRKGISERIVWYNDNGGVECYTFPQGMLCSCEAIVQRVSGGDDKVVGREYLYRLYSAYESTKGMIRIMKMVCADSLYRERQGVCKKIELLTRKLDFDEIRKLKNLSVDIKIREKGGGE